MGRLTEKLNIKGKPAPDTPSDSKSLPTKVAIDPSVLGATAGITLERMLAQSLAYIFVGNETVQKIDDLKSLDKKNKLTDLLDNSVKTIDVLNEIKKELNKLDDPLTRLSSMLFSSKPEGLPVRLIMSDAPKNDVPMPGGEKKGPEKELPENKLKMIIDCDNLDKVLKNLNELSEDDKIKTLADSFKVISESSTNWTSIGKYITDLDESIQSLSKINDVDMAKLKDMGDALKNFPDININSGGLVKFFNDLDKIFAKLAKKDIEQTKKQIAGLNEIFIELNKLETPQAKLDDQSIKLFKSINDIINYIASEKEFDEDDFEEGMEFYKWCVNEIGVFISELTKNDGFKDVSKIPDLKKVEDVLKSINKISEIIEDFPITSDREINAIITFTDKLRDSVLPAISNIGGNKKQLESIKERVNHTYNILTSLLKVAFLTIPFLIIGPIAIAGSKIMLKAIDALDPVIDKLSSKQFKSNVASSKVNAGELGKLIAISGICLIIGGIIMTAFPQLIKGSFAFAFSLGMFIGIVVGMWSLAGKRIGDSMKYAGEFAKLIAVCSLVMVIGGALVLFAPQIIIAAFAFGFALGAFLLMVLGGIGIGAKAIKDGVGKDIQNLHKLIMAASLVMVIGGALVLFAPQILIAAFAFGFVLGAFLLMVVGAISIGSRGLKKAMKDLHKLTKLVKTSTLIMVIGGALVLFFPQIIVGALAFTVVLGLFIFAVTKAISANSKGLKKARKALLPLVALVTVSSLVLMIAGSIIAKHPELLVGMIGFTGALVALVLGVGYAAKFLNKFDKNIKKSLPTMAALSIIILGAAFAIKIVADAIKGVDLLKLLGGIGLMSLTIIAIAGIAIGLGWAIAASAGMFYVGIGAIALIGLVVVSLSFALTSIALTMNVMSKIKPIPTKAILGNILGFVNIAYALFPLSLPLVWFIVSSATVSVQMLSIAISMICEAVQNAASLTIPIYEGTKVVGYRNLKKSDFKAAAENVKEIVSVLGGAIIDIYNKNPEIFSTGTFLGDLLGGSSKFSIVCQSVAQLDKVISNIAKAVRTYASLNIPIYEGTKVVGYEQLKRSDFKSAANNVKEVVVTLGGALIEMYEKHPEMFQDKTLFSSLRGENPSNTPLGMTIAVTSKLGKVISSIARSVQTYANMKYPIEWDKEGKPVKFEKLADSDVINAGNTVKSVVVTFAQALIDLYNEKPEMFQDNSWWHTDASKTPLGMVIGVTSKLGKVISSIASSVQTYANMKYPIEWNKEGKPVKFEKLADSDVINAGNTVKSVVVTFAQALIDLYNEKPEMFQDNSWWHTDASKTPLGMVIGVTSKLGKVISNIAAGVETFANMKYPVKWDKDGKPIDFKLMGTKEIETARDNITNIVSVLGNALMQSYEDHQDWYTQTGGFLGLGKEDAPFVRVVSSNLKLADVVSKIGSAVANIAKLQIPNKWNDEGKVIGYETLSKKHFDMASESISAIVTTLGSALMETFEDHEEWFEDGDDSKFAVSCQAIGHMGSVIGSIAEGIKGYAELKVPEGWDAEGKVTGYRQLNKTDFENAANNINEIVSTLGHSILDIVERHPEWFEDGDDSVFAIACAAVGNMGTTVSNIAEGLKGYADLKMPTEFDKEGKPTGFKQLTQDDFRNASENIGLVVTTIGNSIMSMYNDHPDWFDTGFLGLSDSPFTKVISSITTMGEIISNIAGGIALIATLQMPTKWNTDGTVIESRPITSEEFVTAANNVGTIITTLSYSVMDVYNSNQELFEVDEEHPESTFQKVAQSCSYLGTMISGIAEGIEFFATIWGKTLPNGRKIDQNLVKEAGNNIAIITTTLGKAVAGVYKLDPSLFELPPIKEEKTESALGGLIESTSVTYKPNPGDTPFIKVVKGCGNMGAMIMDIAKGLAFYGTIMSQPLPDGSKIDVNAAAANIGTIITTIGSAIVGVYKQSPDLFDTGYSGDKTAPFVIICNSLNTMGIALSNIARGITAFASMKIPEEYNEEGKPIKFMKLSSNDIKNAAENIKTIITTLASAIMDAAEAMETEPRYESLGLYGISRVKNDDGIINKFKLMGEVISIIGTSIASYASATIPTEWDKDGKPIKFMILDEKTKLAAAENVSSIIKVLANGLSDACDAMKDTWFLEISATLDGIEQAVLTVRHMAYNIAMFGGVEPLTVVDNKGKPLRKITFTKKIFETAGENVNLIVTTLAKSLRSAVDIVCQDKDMQTITTTTSNWFEDIVENKQVSSTGSKILTTMSALFQMNSLLRVLASTTRSWGNGDTETYYTYKNGKLESHQRTVGKIDAPKASSNITKVVTTIATALRSAVDILYQDKDFVEYSEVEEGAFIDTVTTGKKSTTGGKIFTTMSALFSMNSLLRVLAGTARTWGDGSKEIFYEWSNGEVKIKTVDVGKIDANKASSNINIVINSLAKALKSAVDILYKDNDFVQFTKINMFDLFNTEKTSVSGKIATTFRSLLMLNSLLKILAGTIRVWGDGGKSVEIINKNGQLDLSITHSDKLNPEKANENIKNVMLGFVNFINNIKEISPITEDIQKHTSLISNAVLRTSFILYNISSLLSVTEEISNKFKLLGSSIDIRPIILQLKDNIIELNGLNSAVPTSTINSFIPDWMAALDISAPVRRFKNDVNAILNTIENIRNVDISSNVAKLQNGMSSLSSAMNNVKSNNNFTAQTEDLSKYVKAVSGVDVRGVDSLIELMQQLNKLGINMGNMDKLTTAITKNLAKVLSEMTEAITKIDKTMKAEQIRQESRNKEIKQSVGKIAQLMNTEMKVKVSTDDEGNPSSSGSTGSLGGDNVKETPTGQNDDEKNNIGSANN